MDIEEDIRPIFITQNGEAKAVLMDTERYQNMQKAIGILKKVAQGEDDVRKNKVIPQDKVFKRLEKKFK